MGFTRQRKQLSLLLDNSIEVSVKKVTEKITERIIFIENELDKISSNKSLD